MMEKKTSIVISAIICLTLLELAALAMGFNGTLFTVIVAVIAGLAGWVSPTPNKILENIVNTLKGGK